MHGFGHVFFRTGEREADHAVTGGGVEVGSRCGGDTDLVEHAGTEADGIVAVPCDIYV